MSNALAAETSPYLLQHKDNPVDWRPWGPEAFAEAREREVPVLVSIGYSACHWCHVMERESFGDEDVAKVMNERYVCVKVDREERPDVDAIYMEAVQAMSGHGGWPLNVFMTPGQVPFFGGTYFPPQEGQGAPSWSQVLEGVAEAWAKEREQIEAQSAELAERLSGGAQLEGSEEGLTAETLEAAVATLRQSFDSVNGGWGEAPKFPMAPTIEFLLARGEHQMSLQTLRSMASGGIFDQVGGGFARYSTDEAWTVPHFEKMLCDNALLARAYLHGWLVSGDEILKRTCEETLDWALREMRGPEGAFYSALDADSEGVEGRFYVWPTGALYAVLGSDASAAVAWFGATEAGNWEGTNVLESRGAEPPAEVRDRIRAALLEARDNRTRPGTDDKRLTAWNALMIGALAEAGATLHRDDYLDAARTAAAFVLDELRDPDGRLLRTSDGETSRLNAYLEDHAFLLEGLLRLYEATFEPRWFTEARAVADAMIARFADPAQGGFFSTSDDHEQLVTRRKDLDDAPTPSGSSSAALGLLRLAALTGDASYREHAVASLKLVGRFLAEHAHGFGHALQALDLYVADIHEVALVGDTAELAAAVRAELRPHVVLAGGDGTDDGGVPLLTDRPAPEAGAFAYVCEGFTCQTPVRSAAELERLLT